MEEKNVLSESNEEIVSGGTAETAESTAGMVCPKCKSTSVVLLNRSPKERHSHCNNCFYNWKATLGRRRLPS